MAYLGADTPLDTVEAAASSLAPTLVVLSAVTGERVRAVASELRALARRRRVALGGAGVDESEAVELGALALAGDPVDEAERVTALVEAGSA